MRILHLLAGTGWGGAELMGCALHQLSLAHGLESRVDAPAHPEIVEGVRTALAVDLPGPQASETWRWAHFARARRAEFRPDVVHAQLATPALSGAVWWIAGGTPLVLTFQLLPSAARWPNDYLLPVSSSLVLRALVRGRGRCTFAAVGSADRDELRRRFPRATVALTPNLPAPRTAAAQSAPKLPYPEGTLRLLSVGRLVEQKGFDLMLEALAQPAARELGWHWLIVGEGPDRPALELRIAELGLQERVRLLGAMPSDGLFEQAELVLCPSRHEASPLVPREAIRAGVPAVLSDIAPHRELLPGAEASLLPRQPDGWAGSLAALLGSAAAREELREVQLPAAVDRTRELWGTCLGLYEGLLGGRG